MTDELWTLEQLSDQVAALLAQDYDGQQNGRVRELPNGRTIRWYTTIGLVDRPLANRGRVALYGLRHALQLASVKRLQAKGLSLAEIQERLLGASDEELAEVANTPGVEVYHSPGVRIRLDPFHQKTPKIEYDTVIRPVHGFRVGDSVTVTLNDATRAPNETELAELTAAAAPLLAALDRLGLATREEAR
jgi:DNA-binding transcriptional MerR regulator